MNKNVRHASRMLALALVLALVLALLIIASTASASALTGSSCLVESTTHKVLLPRRSDRLHHSAATLSRARNATHATAFNVTTHMYLDGSVSVLLYPSFPSPASPTWAVPTSLFPNLFPIPNSNALTSRWCTDDELATSDPSQPFAVSFFEPFRLVVTRAATSEVVFDTAANMNASVIFEDQYIEISTSKPPTAESPMYGLGGLLTTPSAPNATYTLWARPDNATDNATSSPAAGFAGSWHTHPTYMRLEKSSTAYAHQVLLLNSNAMDIIIQDELVTFKIVGGFVHLTFLPGPTPLDLAAQYAGHVGASVMPPVWALGLQLSDWGCADGHTVVSEVDTLRNDTGLPFDVVHLDPSWLDDSIDYLFDSELGLPDLVQELEQRDLRWLLRLEPGVAALNVSTFDFAPFADALAQNILVRAPNGENVSYTRGLTLDVNIALPDWTLNSSTDWFHDALASWLKPLNAHPRFALLLDREQAYAWCDGDWSSECKRQSIIAAAATDMAVPLALQSTCHNATRDYPALAWPPSFVPPTPAESSPIGPLPYAPGGLDLQRHALNLSAQYSLSIEYNVHNLYGLYEHMRTNDVLVHYTGERTVVMSSATFPGSGQFGGMYLPRSIDSFAALSAAVATVPSSAALGLPYAGTASLCPSALSSLSSSVNPDELCLRAVQAGAFFPFAALSANVSALTQNPYLHSIVAAMQRRYALLPYTYTLFTEAHLSAVPLIRPLLYDAPTDPKAWQVVDQFMFGPALMVAPILEANTTQRQVYVPAGLWYDFYSLDTIMSTGTTISSTSSLDPSNESHVPLLARAAHMLMQREPCANTVEMLHAPFVLTVFSDVNTTNANGRFAHGHNVMDDGVTIDALENGLSSRTNMAFSIALDAATDLLTGSLSLTYVPATSPDFNTSYTAVHLQRIVIAGAPNTSMAHLGTVCLVLDGASNNSTLSGINITAYASLVGSVITIVDPSVAAECGGSSSTTTTTTTAAAAAAAAAAPLFPLNRTMTIYFGNASWACVSQDPSPPNPPNPAPDYEDESSWLNVEHLAPLASLGAIVIGIISAVLCLRARRKRATAAAAEPEVTPDGFVVRRRGGVAGGGGTSGAGGRTGDEGDGLTPAVRQPLLL